MLVAAIFLGTACALVPPSVRTSIRPPAPCIHASATSVETSVDEDNLWDCLENGVSSPKLSIRPTSVLERGKGGVFATENIAAMEVIAIIPRDLVLSADATAVDAASQATSPSWAAELTAAALLTLHPPNEEASTHPKSSVLVAISPAPSHAQSVTTLPCSPD